MHAVLFAILPVLAATNVVSVPNIERFPRMSQGRYEVLAQRDKNTAWQVVWFMNRMAEHYAKEFTNAMPAARARVLVFSNHDDFAAYAKEQRGDAQRGLAGYTAVRKDPGGGRQWELVTFEYPGQWRTLAHEGFHQFLGYQFGDRYNRIPVWLNEGLAQYFETSYILNQKLVVGSVSAEKLKALRDELGKKTAPGVPVLLQMGSVEYYRDSQVNYPLSWALVYYLQRGDYSATPAAAFGAYLEDVKQGLTDTRTFERHFGSYGPTWQERFEKYFQTLTSQVD